MTMYTITIRYLTTNEEKKFMSYDSNLVVTDFISNVRYVKTPFQITKMYEHTTIKQNLREKYNLNLEVGCNYYCYNGDFYEFDDFDELKDIMGDIQEDLKERQEAILSQCKKQVFSQLSIDIQKENSELTRLITDLFDLTTLVRNNLLDFEEEIVNFSNSITNNNYTNIDELKAAIKQIEMYSQDFSTFSEVNFKDRFEANYPTIFF